MPLRLLRLLLLLLLSTLTACTALDTSPQLPAHAYYLSATGNDSNPGTSPTTSWKTLDRANQTTFQPGDAILFHAGDTFTGQLQPKGSGTLEHPICIDRYGNGPDPIINLASASGAAVKLTNQEYWTLQHLEVTSGAPPEPGKGRQGIVALAEGPAGHTGHILIQDCYFHDIWGQLGGGGPLNGYNSAAIFVGPAQGAGGGGGGGGQRNPNVGADDITIQTNRIARVDRCGIIIWQGHDHILVAHNDIENLGGDAIFMNGCRAGIMEYNTVRRSCMRTGDPDLPITGSYNPHSAAMWIQNCTDTLIQFNQAFDTGRQKGNGDGNAYDFDFNCRNCFVQYNYSRNNHGFLLIMERTQGNVARYNISENDQSHLIQTHGTLDENNLVCNNVFYVDYGTIDMDIYMGNTEVPDAAKRLLGAHFENNIFYAAGGGHFRTVYTYDSALNRKFLDQVHVDPPTPGALFNHNCYFGTWLTGLPSDPNPLKADPLFRAPGTGGAALAALTGYQLRPDSPCLHTATPLPNRGPRDFFGNPLQKDTASFGAFEPTAP